jgi:hypothetical protein
VDAIQLSSGNQQDHFLDLLVRYMTIIGAKSKDKLQTKLRVHIMMQCSSGNQQDHCVELHVRPITIIGAKFMDEIQTQLPIHHLREALWRFSLMIHTKNKNSISDNEMNN